MIDDWLASVNESLVDVDRSLRCCLPEQYPIVHVVGAPRSGTTLLTQILARHLEFAYVSNIAARFYRAPLVGQRLARDILGPGYFPSTLESAFGRSTGADGPHEYGQFWRDVFGEGALDEQRALETEADWKKMETTFMNLAAFEERPLIVKNLLGAWRLGEIKARMPQTGVVMIVRDTVDNAASLLRLREGLHGSINTWASVRPLTCSDVTGRTPYEQVVMQVRDFNREIDRQIDEFGCHFVRVSYEQLCNDPKSVLDLVASLLVNLGWHPTFRNGVPEPLIKQTHRDDSELERIRRALRRMT